VSARWEPAAERENHDDQAEVGAEDRGHDEDDDERGTTSTHSVTRISSSSSRPRE
jgi:hypothetical protein